MSLSRTLVRGAAWTALVNTSVRVLGIVGNIIILRWLTPDALGVVNATQSLVVSAAAISTLGIGPYLLVKRDCGRAAVFHSAVIHMALGALAIVAMLAVGSRWDAWFDAPGLAGYLRVLVLSMVADRIFYVPERLLVRDLRFIAAGNIKALGELTFTGLSIVLVHEGYGPMGIVYASVARSVVKMLAALRLVPLREWFDVSALRLSTAKQIASFGAKFWAQSFSGVAVTKWDNFIVSGFYGPGVLANYNQSYNFAEMPMSQVGEQMTDLLMPSFTAIEPSRRSDAALRALGLITLSIFPLAIGMGCVSDSLVRSLPIKASWYGMIAMLPILCLLGVFRSVSNVLSSYLNAQSRPGLTVALDCFCLAALLALDLTVGRVSPLFACGASVSAFAARAAVNVFVVARVDGRPATDYLGPIARVLAACAPMVAAVLGVRHLLASHGLGIPILSLGCEIVAGAIAYVLGSLVFARSITLDFVATFRDALLRRRKT